MSAKCCITEKLVEQVWIVYTLHRMVPLVHGETSDRFYGTNPKSNNDEVEHRIRNRDHS